MYFKNPLHSFATWYYLLPFYNFYSRQKKIYRRKEFFVLPIFFFFFWGGIKKFLNYIVFRSCFNSLFRDRKLIFIFLRLQDRSLNVVFHFSGLGALHLARSEFAISAGIGGLLAGVHVPSSVRYRGIFTASRWSANIPQVQPVRLGRAVDLPRVGDSPAKPRKQQFLECRWSHSLQLLVRLW